MKGLSNEIMFVCFVTNTYFQLELIGGLVAGGDGCRTGLIARAGDLSSLMVRGSTVAR